MTTTRTIVAAACALLLAACGKGSKSSGSDAGCVPFDAGTASSALVQQGLSIIEQRSCQQCHGGLLSGNNDGVNVPGTNIIQYPPNLSSDPATGLGCWTDDQIVRAILYGIDNEGAVMCPPMPQWADAGMTDSDARAVVAFLRTLPPVVNNVELVGRYDSVRNGYDGNSNSFHFNTQRYTLGGIYYFSSTLLFEADYEFLDSNDPSQVNQLILQLSYGF